MHPCVSPCHYLITSNFSNETINNILIETKSHCSGTRIYKTNYCRTCNNVRTVMNIQEMLHKRWKVMIGKVMLGDIWLS